MIKKVSNAQGNGTWEKDGKTFYKFQYEFEDGFVFDAMHMTPAPKFQPGDEVEIEQKGSRNGVGYGKMNRVGANKSFGGSSYSKPSGSTQMTIEAQWAINAVLNFYASNGTEADFPTLHKDSITMLRLRDEVIKGYNQKKEADAQG